MAKPARPKPKTPRPSIKERLRKRLAAEGAGDIFAAGWYPHQLAKPTDDTLCSPKRKYMGELRGFYPAGRDKKKRLENGIIYAWLSIPHKNDTGNTRGHSGIDIYAPYFPYPHEIPIYAIADGEIWNRTEWNDRKSNGKRESLGNRMHLKVTEPSDGNRAPRELAQISYGHLSRFAGDDWGSENNRQWRTVKAGELIGSAGVSGNANGDKEGTWRTPKFKFNAGHVHLQALSGILRSDLYDVLPRKLAFHPDLGHLTPPLKDERKQSVTKPGQFSDGVLRDDPPTPKIPDVHLQSVQTTSLQKPDAGSVQRYPEPFQWLDAARAGKIKATHEAYEAAVTRLDEERYRKEALTVWGKKLKSTDDRTKFHLDDVTALIDRSRDMLEAVAKPEGEAPPDLPPRGAQALLSVMHLMEAQYVLMGGPAIEVVNQSVSNKKPDRPRCGFGIMGINHALAYPGAVAAVQYCRPEILVDGTPKEQLTYSVTFGAGSMRHATISVLATRDTYLPSTDTDKRAVKLAIFRIGRGARAICRLHKFLQSNHYRISRREPDWYAKFADEWNKVVKEQTAALATITRLNVSQKTALLRSIVKSNRDLLNVALIQVNNPTAKRLAPALSGLKLALTAEGGSACDNPHH